MFQIVQVFLKEYLKCRQTFVQNYQCFVISPYLDLKHYLAVKKQDRVHDTLFEAHLTTLVATTVYVFVFGGTRTRFTSVS